MHCNVVTCTKYKNALLAEFYILSVMDVSCTGQTLVSPLSRGREGLELIPEFYGMEMKLKAH